MSSKPELHSVESALEYLLANACPLPEVEMVALSDADNRIVAEDVHAALDVPPADNSAMDGYAIRYSDLEKTNNRLLVSQRITAGKAATPLAPNSAARIFTGAEIPHGADAVVMQEECGLDGDSVVVKNTPSPGDNIRRRGQDIANNSVVVSEGSRLRPQEVGLLASIGLSEVSAYRKLEVAVVTTGDELVDPGTSLNAGQIYNSNKPLLESLLKRIGLEPASYATAADNLQATLKILRQASNSNDLIITCGGVSVGEEDYVKAAIEELGELELWRVAIKPGKPLVFGQVNNTPIIGLPGNPSSVFVTFLILARPWLLKSQGGNPSTIENAEFTLPAMFSRRAGSRQEYLRARLTNNGVEIFSNQSSGVLSSASWGDGLVIQPAGKSIQTNDLVKFIPYRELY